MTTYREAGVDIDAQDRALEQIKKRVRATYTDGVLSDQGAFGGMFRVPGGLEDPVLVASADGVGTKLRIAFLSGRHGTVGQDLVNHCINDILVQGARPLFFLDYLATGRLDPSVAAEVIGGVATACREANVALLGGETAEMPGFYGDGEYDLAGFIVGVVDKPRILDGSAVADGDILVGLPSTGLHTNGYSLARHVVFETLQLEWNDPLPEVGRSVADELLAIHRCYLKPLWPWSKAAGSAPSPTSPAAASPTISPAFSPPVSGPSSRSERGRSRPSSACSPPPARFRKTTCGARSTWASAWWRSSPRTTSPTCSNTCGRRDVPASPWAA
jgi:phosphoribosylformylglycinamidine cyclo-ligase